MRQGPREWRLCWISLWAFARLSAELSTCVNYGPQPKRVDDFFVKWESDPHRVVEVPWQYWVRWAIPYKKCIEKSCTSINSLGLLVYLPVKSDVIYCNFFNDIQSFTSQVRGCTQEFPATKSKEHIEVPLTQQQKRQKEQTLTTRAPPPNRQFPISMHWAEIEWS